MIAPLGVLQEEGGVVDLGGVHPRGSPSPDPSIPQFPLMLGWAKEGRAWNSNVPE